VSSSDDQAADLLELLEAELDSLKEELTVAMGKRHRFVTLRVAYLEKQLPDIRKKAADADYTAKWLARINHPKRT
jgi:uracil-DNA glycosylase